MDALDINQTQFQNLDTLKPRWNFIAFSVIATCLLSFYYSWAYSHILSFVTDNISNLERRTFPFENRGKFINDFANMYLHMVIASLFFFAAQICAVVAVCVFYYRATNNLYKANLPTLIYTGGWAVGWFFIPFVQLVMPLLVTLQLWRGSKAIADDDKDGWKRKGISPWIYIWYISFIGSILFLFIYSLYMQSTMLKEVINQFDDLNYSREIRMQNAQHMANALFEKISTLLYIYDLFWVV